MQKRADMALTDLEGAVLGYVATQGPVTTYAVARVFAASPSEFWSGSAGAVYPLMKRLLARGLLAGERGTQGQRAATWYSITAAGRAELKGWLLDTERAAGMGFDPLRTRLEFLPLVSEAERQRFLDAVARRSEARAASDELDDDPDAQSWFKARLAWLKKLGARFP